MLAQTLTQETDGDGANCKKPDSTLQVEVSTIPTIIITPPEDGKDDICTESEPLVDKCESEEKDDERPTLWTSLARSTSPQDGLFVPYDEGSGDQSDSDLESEEEDECTRSEITMEEKKSKDVSFKLKATTATVDVIINEGDEPRIATLADTMVIPTIGITPPLDDATTTPQQQPPVVTDMVIPTIVITPPLDDATTTSKQQPTVVADMVIPTIVITPPLDDTNTTPQQQPPVVISKPSDDLLKVVDIEGTLFPFVNKATSSEDLSSREKYGLQLTRDVSDLDTQS